MQPIIQWSKSALTGTLKAVSSRTMALSILPINYKLFSNFITIPFLSNFCFTQQDIPRFRILNHHVFKDILQFRLLPPGLAIELRESSIVNFQIGHDLSFTVVTGWLPFLRVHAICVFSQCSMWRSKRSWSPWMTLMTTLNFAWVPHWNCLFYNLTDRLLQ